MRFSSPCVALLVLCTPGCGLILDRSYPDAGSDARQAPHDAGPDAPRTMDASFDASRDAGSEVEPDIGGDAPTVMDVGIDAPLDALAIDTGHDAAVTMSAGDASFDVGRSDAGIRTLCGNGVVEGGEACDLGRAGLFDPLSPCDWSCQYRSGTSCKPPHSIFFPSELTTERGGPATSQWTWSVNSVTWQHALTTDEENCLIYPGRVGYLHSVELGQPGQDGWISPAMGGCGVAEPHPSGSYMVYFQRDFSAPAGVSFDLIIGADNGVEGVYLDGEEVTPVTDLLDTVLDGHFVPRYRVRIDIPPESGPSHRLRIVVRELGAGGGIATGVSVNEWNPSRCVGIGPLP